MDAPGCKEQRNPQVKEGQNSRDACGNKLLEISLGLMALQLLSKYSNSSRTPAEALIVPQPTENKLVRPLEPGHYSDSAISLPYSLWLLNDFSLPEVHFSLNKQFKFQRVEPDWPWLVGVYKLLVPLIRLLTAQPGPNS